MGEADRILMVLDDREDLLREMSRLGLKPQATVALVEHSEDTWRVLVAGPGGAARRRHGKRVFVGGRAA